MVLKIDVLGQVVAQFVHSGVKPLPAAASIGGQGGVSRDPGKLVQPVAMIVVFEKHECYRVRGRWIFPGALHHRKQDCFFLLQVKLKLARHINQGRGQSNGGLRMTGVQALDLCRELREFGQFAPVSVIVSLHDMVNQSVRLIGIAFGWLAGHRFLFMPRRKSCLGS